MSQRLAIACRGLVTAPNPLIIPKDALTAANNVVIDRPGFIQSRPGFERVGAKLGGSIWKLFEANGLVFANWGSVTEAASVARWDDTAQTWSAIAGTATNPPERRMHAAEADGYAYLTSTEGVWRLLVSDMEFAGIPKALGLDKEGPGAVLSSSSPTFLLDGNCVAYRAVIGVRLGLNTIRLGAPSSRTVIYNASTTSGYVGAATANVTARVLLPTLNNTDDIKLTEQHFVQLYRSAQVAATVTPDDDLQLVSERFLTFTDILNGYIDMVDGTPDTFRGGFLYTNPNVGGDEGLVAGITGVANDPPPNAVDVAKWRDCLWYAGTTSRYRTLFQILGTGTGGLAAGHTLEIANRTYTAVAPGGAGPTSFVVETGGNVSQNIEETAQNLVACINKDASADREVWAFYVSGESPDAPGKILIERRTLAQTSFTIVASNNGDTGYVPSLAGLVSSTRDVFPDALMFSRAGLPEAVPSVNQIRVGSGSATILKIVPLRGSLFVFTTEGLYRVVGDTFSDFSVREFDLSVVLLGRECTATLRDEIYAWCSNGVARISESGLEWISGDIDFDLQNVISTATRETIAKVAFLVANPQDRRVLLWYPIGDTEEVARAAYCFSARSSAWTTWNFGTVLGAADGRSSGVFGTYVRHLYLSEAIQHSDCSVFLETALPTDKLSDDSRPGIARAVAWAQQDDGNAGLLKHWTEAQILFGEDGPSRLTLTFEGDFATDSVTLTDLSADLRLQRMPIGSSAGRGTRLAVTAASSIDGAGFDIAGLSLFCRPLSSRGMK